MGLVVGLLFESILGVGCLQWLGGGFVLNCVLGCGGCGGCGGGCWLFAVAVDCV